MSSKYAKHTQWPEIQQQVGSSPLRGDEMMPASRTIYHRGFVLGDANSSYAEVAGKPALSRAAIRSIV